MLDENSRLGSCTLLSHIGNGSFGYVFKAKDSKIPEEIALKICKSPCTDDEKQRFKIENAILHTLKVHENIVIPHSEILGESGYLYYLMELADSNLEQYLNANYNLSTNQKIELFLTVCRAILYAHKKEIVHRDLWWRNILIKHRDLETMPKVTDFGRGKDYNSTFSTPDGEKCWGYLYITPPESYFFVDSDSSIQHHILSDIYALGILLYYFFENGPAYSIFLLGSIEEFHKKVKFNPNGELKQRVNYYNGWLESFDTILLEKLRINSDIENDKINEVIKLCCEPNYKKRIQSVEQIIKILE